jgi:hypothetical protein
MICMKFISPCAFISEHTSYRRNAPSLEFARSLSLSLRTAWYRNNEVSICYLSVKMSARTVKNMLQ